MYHTTLEAIRLFLEKKIKKSNLKKFGEGHKN